LIEADKPIIQAGAQVAMPACGLSEMDRLDRADLFEGIDAQADIGCGLIESQGCGPIW
jgi:hypothetical protein